MSPKDLFGCEWDEPAEEPNDSNLLEDERPNYFPPDTETIDAAMLAMTGERLPPGRGEDDAWVRPRHCLVCGARDSAAFNRAARFYICFDTGCAVRVGVGGDSTATRMFRPQIETAVRKILGNALWGDWRNT